MGNRTSKNDVAPMVRGAFLNALEEIKRTKGKTFSQIIADWLLKDPASCINAIAKFNPRETKGELHVSSDFASVLIGLDEAIKSRTEDSAEMAERPRHLC